MPVRTSTKAIIIEEGKLLVSQYRNSAGKLYYGLPGGGQELQETLPEALKRECFEEILALVEVGDIVFIRDFIRKNHVDGPDEKRFHQVDFFFECKLLNHDEIGIGPAPDNRQIGVVWMEIEALKKERFFPEPLLAHLSNGKLQGGPVYLGDID
jgi:8-oxo-dGTP diphosphatase